MLAVDQIVGIHNCADVRFLHGGFECGQVDLTQGALVDDGIAIVAEELGVIAEEMFHGGTDALLLHAGDVTGGDGACEKWIFAEVFKVPAVHGRAVNVDAGSEHEVNAAGAGVLADACTNAFRQLRIPGGSKADAGRVSG